MERQLATIRKIREIKQIDGADSIELAFVDGWQCVIAKKDNFKVGDLCIYFEIDSVLPEHPEFEFLRDKKFRIRTIKLRGKLSQGLIMPLSILTSFFSPEDIQSLNKDWARQRWDEFLIEGRDVTDIIGVTKYEPPIPAQLAGSIRGNFPSEVPKTDESRIQNITKELELFREMDIEFVGTEKVDGSSSTFILLNDDFQVCSRNLNLKEFQDTKDDGEEIGERTKELKNTFWKYARENDVEQKIRFYCEQRGIKNMAIQGELLGEGIQKNKYKLKGQEVYLFNAFNIDTQKYFDWQEFQDLITITGLKQVPVVFESAKLEYLTVDDLLMLVEGKSYINKDIEREGVVFKSKHKVDMYGHSFGKISFKVINNKFLLKYNDE